MARRILSFVLSLALVTSLTMIGGCAQGGGGDEEPEGDQPVAGGTLTYFIVEPSTIDPYAALESEGIQVVQAIFDSLTQLDPITADVEPAAAESWESNDDATVWTFKLRSGDTFSDGIPVKASDYVYGWNRIANPKTDPKNPSTISYHLAAVKGYDEVQKGDATEMEGVKALDDGTLEVTLSYSFADFPAVVAHPDLGPQPKDAVENGVKYTDADGNEKTAEYKEMPLGNGPFKMAEPWKHDQYIKLVKNDNYAGAQKPYLDGVEFKIFKDQETAYLEFEGGNLDFTDIPDGKIEEAKTKFGESEDGYTVKPGKGVLLGAELATYYLVCNMDDEVFKNKDIREAVSYAVNRQAIVDTVYEGTRIPATGINPPGVMGFQENAWPASTYDVEKAKEALAKAGYGTDKPLDITLSFNTGGGHERVMELVQADLKVIGINAKLDSTDFAAHLKNLDEGSFQLARLGWIADYPIMDNFLYPEFQSEAGDNYSKFKSADVDQKLEDARSTLDEQERVAAYQEIERAIGAEVPVVPIVFYAHRHVGSNRLNDFVYSSTGLASFETAWITGGGAE